MALKIHSVMIGTEDLPRLAAFYRDVVGLKPEMEDTNFVVFAGEGGAQLALGVHSEVKGRAKDPDRVIVDFQVDDCQAEYARLNAKGVEFARPPSQDQGAIIATFADPDGNLLQLFQMT